MAKATERKRNPQDATLRNERASKKQALALVDALRALMSAVVVDVSTVGRQGLRRAEMQLRRVERWAGRDDGD